MPPLQSLTLQEISSRFTREDEFYFHSLVDGMVTFMTTKDLTYTIRFFPTEYADLRVPCTIDDIIAAIDTNRFFELSIIL